MTPESTIVAKEFSSEIFSPEREVRFAVVMYGGVSLAIYINGVAQELLNLVRATAPKSADPDEDQILLADNELTGAGAVYLPSNTASIFCCSSPLTSSMGRSPLTMVKP